MDLLEEILHDGHDDNFVVAAAGVVGVEIATYVTYADLRRIVAGLQPWHCSF